MLVLTRRIGEKIVIDGGIILTILEIGTARVRVGIEAPKDVMILRSELLDQPPTTKDDNK